jgi:RNA recognition motif-containing protein
MNMSGIQMPLGMANPNYLSMMMQGNPGSLHGANAQRMMYYGIPHQQQRIYGEGSMMMGGSMDNGFGMFSDGKPPYPNQTRSPRQPAPKVEGATDSSTTTLDNQGPQQTGDALDTFDDEKRTLRCTGIPPYVQDSDLIAHFVNFGDITELLYINLAENANSSNEGSGKMYNECLVQFFSAESAKKCLKSPTAVLQNRYIKLFWAPQNIISINKIPAAPKYTVHDKKSSYASNAKKYSNSFGTSKWNNEYNVYKSSGGDVPASTVQSDQEPIYDGLKVPTMEEYNAIDGLKSNQSEGTAQLSESAKAKLLEREQAKQLEKQLAKQQYEELRNLRSQANVILKQKMTLLQVSMK